MSIESILNLVIGIFIGSGAGAVVGTYVGYRMIRRNAYNWLQGILKELNKRKVVHEVFKWLEDQGLEEELKGFTKKFIGDIFKELDDEKAVHMFFEWLKKEGLTDKL